MGLSTMVKRGLIIMKSDFTRKQLQNIRKKAIAHIDGKLLNIETITYMRLAEVADSLDAMKARKEKLCSLQKTN